jgi:hypothetical protein
VAIDPRSNNRSILNLLEFYALNGDRVGYHELRARFPQGAHEFPEIAKLDRKIRQ